MSRRFMRNLKIVAIIHAVLFMLVMLGSWLRAWGTRDKPITIPIEFMVAVSESQPTPAAPVSPPPPDPAVSETPRPPEDPAPTPRKKINVSRKRVTRTSTPRRREPMLSEEEIRKLLQQGATPADRTSVPSEDQRNLLTIRRRLYGLWLQPSHAEAGDAGVEVRLRFAPDGRVLEKSISRPSGNRVLDDSVRDLLSKITRIEGLSSGFIARHPVVTVAFRVEN